MINQCLITWELASSEAAVTSVEQSPLDLSSLMTYTNMSRPIAFISSTLPLKHVLVNCSQGRCSAVAGVSDFQSREPGFECWAAVMNPGQVRSL